MLSTCHSRFHAIFASYISIFTGITTVVLAILVGNAELSMSLIGIALVGITDVAASILVLSIYLPVFLSPPESRCDFIQKRQEARYSIAIGFIMICLGLFLFVDRYGFLCRMFLTFNFTITQSLIYY